MHPLLESARLKVERGETHLISLRAPIDTFLERHPKVVESYIESDTGEKIYRLQRALQKPPAELSPIVGDTLHNFRSALDHLMWEVVQRCGGMPIEGITQFPIFESIDAFRDSERIRQVLKGVWPEVQTMLERLQPGGGSNPVTEMLLASVHHLNIVDKHRHPNLMTTAHLGLLPVHGRDIHIAREIQDSLFSGVGRVEQSAILGRIPREHVDVPFVPTFDVAFGEGSAAGQPVIPLLDSIRAQVESLLHDFGHAIASTK